METAVAVRTAEARRRTATARSWVVGRRSSLVLLALAVFALALGPRWLARDTYVTADEDNWMRRAGGFAWGLANGRPGRTYQNGHPGVLTMELAILGQGPAGAERFADPVTGNPRLVTAVPDFFEGLVQARRAFAVASALLVVGITLLSARVFGAGPAVAGGLLVALDPFYLAHSQLVHLDALLSGCMTLAALCAVIRWGRGGGRRWVLAGGVLTGLALLAKVPAVYLSLFVPGLALALGRRRGARALATDLMLWGLGAVVAFIALWPSMWVNPAGTLTRMLEFARETGGQPHEQGSFFLGQPVVDPGPLFYPVALALRLSPVVVVGLLALGVLASRGRSCISPGRWRGVLALLAYAAGFAAFMTLGAKKFDRYLLPAFPVVDLLAGLALYYCLSRLARTEHDGRSHRLADPGGAQPPRLTDPSRPRSGSGAGGEGDGTPSTRRRWGVASAALAMVALAAWPALSVFPHYLAFYNPLAGGGAAAVQAIPVGEGEGLKEAAAWLNARPDAADLRIVSDSFDVLQANFLGSGETLRERVPGSASYVVLYVYHTQIGHAPRVAAEYSGRQPEHVVRLNGIDYARIYRGPRQ